MAEEKYQFFEDICRSWIQVKFSKIKTKTEKKKTE